MSTNAQPPKCPSTKPPASVRRLLESSSGRGTGDARRSPLNAANKTPARDGTVTHPPPPPQAATLTFMSSTPPSTTHFPAPLSSESTTPPKNLHPVRALEVLCQRFWDISDRRHPATERSMYTRKPSVDMLMPVRRWQLPQQPQGYQRASRSAADHWQRRDEQLHA